MKRLRHIFHLCISIILISTFYSCGKFSQTQHQVKPVYYQSAVELAASIQKGEITSSELLEHYLVPNERYNGDVNAVVAMDVKAARARAAKADKAIAKGQIWGPLHGLPMTVKDVFEVAGLPATSGDSRLKSHLPDLNAVAVQRLIDAGAIVFGKTNTPFYASDFQTFNKVYGTTNNPWDLVRTPGGSSGGSAVSLAMGFTAMELGSDLGGSLRIPAHYTGVYGHKPTFGVVPRLGHIPPPPGMVPDHIVPMIPLFVAGPMARSAEDLEMAMEVLTAQSRPKLLPLPKKTWKDYRVAVWLTDPYAEAEIDAEVLSTLRNTVDKLRKAGVKVDDKARPGVDLKDSRQLFLDIYNVMREGPLPRKLIARQKAMQEKWAAFFKNYDVLLAPVTPTTAFEHNQTQPKTSRHIIVNGKQRRYMSNPAWTLMAVVSGLPATAAPVGLSDSGLPIGIQIIGARLEDKKSIAFAKGLSSLVGGFVAPPPYSK